MVNNERCNLLRIKKGPDYSGINYLNVLTPMKVAHLRTLNLPETVPWINNCRSYWTNFTRKMHKVFFEKIFTSLIMAKRECGLNFPIFHWILRNWEMPLLICFVSFGGDGTILRARTPMFVNLGIPIVGVNTGRLGFLSTFGKRMRGRLVHGICIRRQYCCRAKFGRR